MIDGKQVWLENTQDIAPGSQDYPAVKIRGTMEGIYFSLARYHFVIRMLANKKHITVLDLGCNNGLQDRFIEQKCDIDKLVGIDFDHNAIEIAKQEVASEKMCFLEDDFLGKDYTAKISGGVQVCTLNGCN